MCHLICIATDKKKLDFLEACTQLLHLTYDVSTNLACHRLTRFLQSVWIMIFGIPSIAAASKPSLLPTVHLKKGFRQKSGGDSRLHELSMFIPYHIDWLSYTRPAVSWPICIHHIPAPRWSEPLTLWLRYHCLFRRLLQQGELFLNKVRRTQ